MELKRKKIDSIAEKNMLTGLITSDRFCKEVMPVVRPEFLQVEYSKILVGWVKEYYEQYGTAPGKDIENIFLVKREQLKPEVSSLLQTYLSNLSENYDDEANINHIAVSLETEAFCYFNALLVNGNQVDVNTSI